MEKKSILITGCSSGIGLCVAEGLLKLGYRVFATARKNEDVEALLNQGMESFQLDLDDSASIRGAVHEVLNKTEGKLFALFNNGGFGQPGAVEDLRRDVLREQFETNRLHEIIKNNFHLSMKDLDKIIFHELDRFKGEEDFLDDTALLSCRFF